MGHNCPPDLALAYSRKHSMVGILLISGYPIKPKDCGDVGT